MRSETPVSDWPGRYRSYDLLREIAIAFLVVVLLTLLLAALFGAPQRKAVTFQEWSTQDPIGFLTTTLGELSGTSDTARYGPPYNDTPGAAQSEFGVAPATIAGVSHPIDTSEDLVLRPLGRLAAGQAGLGAAVARYRSATSDERQTWIDAYSQALSKASSPADLTGADTGPVPQMLEAMLSMAQSGGLDAALVDATPSGPGFFVMDYTRSQLYLADGDYLANLGDAAGLSGDQWGMMATIGNWPGQVWLIPATVWYQFPPGSTSGNGDVIVWSIVGVLCIASLLTPYIPGLRALPRRLGVYRLIWRRYYAAATTPDSQ